MPPAGGARSAGGHHLSPSGRAPGHRGPGGAALTRPRRRSWFFGLLGAGACLGLLGADRLSGLLAINLTPSLPRGLYRVTPLRVQPGALVTFCLPVELIERHGLARWIAPGRCPGGRAPLCKRIVLVGPGEARCGTAVWQVPRGEVFVRGASRLSKDSCVFGPVPTVWLRRGVVPLWTL